MGGAPSTFQVVYRFYRCLLGFWVSMFSCGSCWENLWKTSFFWCRKIGNGYSSGVFQKKSLLAEIIHFWLACFSDGWLKHQLLWHFWARSGSGHFLVQSFFAPNKTLGRHCHEDVWSSTVHNKNQQFQRSSETKNVDICWFVYKVFSAQLPFHGWFFIS